VRERPGLRRRRVYRAPGRRWRRRRRRNGGWTDAGAHDAGARDAGLVDAGAIDAGLVDAGAIDAGLVDAGAIDAGLVDAGAIYAGLVDAGLVDAGLVDAGIVDAGIVDAGLLDAGLLDAGVPEPVWVDLGPGPCGGAGPFLEEPWHVSALARFPVVVDPACVVTSASAVHVPIVLTAGLTSDLATARVFEGDEERAADVEKGSLGGTAVVWTRLDLTAGDAQRVLWVYLAPASPDVAPAPFDDQIAVWHMDDAPVDGQESATSTTGYAPVALPSANTGIARIDGQIGAALSAPGQFHTVDDHPLIDVQTGAPFTIDLWFKRTGGASNEQLVMKESNCVGYQLFLTSGGDLFLMVSSGASCEPQVFSQIFVEAPVGTFRNDAWHHVVVGVDRESETLFAWVDGDTFTHANDAYPDDESAENAAALRIGASVSGGNIFGGALDEMRLHALPRDDNRVLLEDAAARGFLIESGPIAIDG
jgi:hypothetical protein